MVIFCCQLILTLTNFLTEKYAFYKFNSKSLNSVTFFQMPKRQYVACMVHCHCLPNWIFEGNMYRPFHTLRKLHTHQILWKYLDQWQRHATKTKFEICVWSYKTDGRILLMAPILTSVIFRGPSCVWSYKISRKSLNVRLSYVIQLFYTYL